MTEFTAAHHALLERFAAMSAAAGARSDYVQGGGGNTSVKLPGGLMAIKASGYCLSDVTAEGGYAVLDGAALRLYQRIAEGLGLPLERVLADALFKLAGELSLEALHTGRT